MKRFPGIIISAIVLLLGSLFQLLMAVLMGLGGILEQRQIQFGGHLSGVTAAPTPAWLPIFTYVLSALFVSLAAWGILTAVGLFRVRRWARYSVLIIGGCLALIGLPSMVMMLVLTAIPLPVPASVDVTHVHTAQTITRIVLGTGAAFYGFVCAVGISWLVYFNLKKVRGLFADAAGLPAHGRRPFLISTIAVLSLIGALTCILVAILPVPGGFFGWILQGWAKVAVLLAWAALLAASGVGLWRLDEWGRRLTLAVQALGLAQYVVFLVRPSLMTRYSEEVGRSMNLAHAQQLPPQFQAIVYNASFGLGMLVLLAIVAILHHYRTAFRRHIEPSQNEPAAIA
jgi:uncharacterized membrane protein (DUF2068 family)